MKPILITGAAGFIGARFVETCNHRQQPVISVDLLPFFDERPEHRGLDFGTRIDRDQMLEWLSMEKPELAAIVHMGACSDTTELDEGFLRRVNVESSQGLWNYATQMRIPLVYASSAATYGAGEAGYEDDETRFGELKPLNPYGESKRIFDLWALEQEKLGHHPPRWSGFKFFNVYGFGERHKGRMASVVLHAFDQIRAEGKVRLFRSHREGIADGEQKRDFVYVQDVVDVMEFALEKVDRGIYNLGTGKARTFLDLARAVFASLDRSEKIDFVDTPLSIRDRYQYFTEARMQRLQSQGYTRPFTPLEKGVKEYVQRLLRETD